MFKALDTSQYTSDMVHVSFDIMPPKSFLSIIIIIMYDTDNDILETTFQRQLNSVLEKHKLCTLPSTSALKVKDQDHTCPLFTLLVQPRHITYHVQNASRSEHWLATNRQFSYPENIKTALKIKAKVIYHQNLFTLGLTIKHIPTMLQQFVISSFPNFCIHRQTQHGQTYEQKRYHNTCFSHTGNNSNS